MSNENGFLYSIQSLRKIDFENKNDTGNQLVDFFDSFSFRQKKVFTATTKEMLFAALKEIKNEVAKFTDEIVFLSLDTHGSDDYLEITDIFNNPVKVAWQDIAPYVIDINVASKLKLVILSSCCRGASFLKFLKYDKDKAPYFYFFGPKDNAVSNHILSFNEQFVELIYNASASDLENIPQQVLDFNKEWEKNHPSDTHYIATNACDLFISIYKKMLDVLLSPTISIMKVIKIQKKRQVLGNSLMAKEEMNEFFCEWYSKSENEKRFIKSWNDFLLNVQSFQGITPQQIFDKIWLDNNSIKQLALAQKYGGLFSITGAVFSEAVQHFKL